MEQAEHGRARMPLIPVVNREFEACLVYRGSSRAATATEKPCLKKQEKKKRCNKPGKNRPLYENIMPYIN